MTEKTYAGLEEDLKNGMTPTAKIVLDGRVFGLIADGETCKGWNVAGVQALYDKVGAAWEEYGLIPSRLPDDLRRHHGEIYGAAIKMAKDYGWDPEAMLEDDN